MTKKVVTPKYFEGWNMSLAQLFGSGPKFTITCGNCSGTFQKRIPIVNHPGIACPYCGAINRLPIEVE